MYKQKNKGVTILELLVVVLIIGALMFVLNPIVKHLQFVVKQQNCMDNLKSISLALRIYALENEHKGPEQIEVLVDKGYIKEETLCQSWEPAENLCLATCFCF
jgi:prepilin-type N-terminal cleavage/methylation domain-containing protein